VRSGEIGGRDGRRVNVDGRTHVGCARLGHAQGTGPRPVRCVLLLLPAPGVDGLLEHCAGGELGYRASRDLDLRPGVAGVDTSSRGALRDGELAKAGELNVVAALERVADLVENGLHSAT
jgi:hypothetical protein